MAISIATLNINGLRDVNKIMGFIQWLHLLNYDVLCLQESYIISKVVVRGFRPRYTTASFHRGRIGPADR